MTSLLLRLIFNAVGLFIATRIVPGISFEGDWTTLVLVALIFGVVNALVRPILEMLTCPLIVLTLGLFVFVINALMLALTSWIAGQLNLGFSVDGFVPALLGAIVIGVVSFVLSLVFRDEPRERARARTS